MQPKTINVMQCRSTYTTGGGPDKTALLIAERADREMFNVALMYMRGALDHDFQIARWARQRGLTVHEVLERRRLDLSNLAEISSLVRKHSIDIFHARDYKTCFIGFLLSLVTPRMRLVFTAHGWIVDSAKMKFYTWLNLRSLRAYHRIIAVSRATKKIMVDSGIDAAKIEVIYNAIDVEAWQRCKADGSLREELGISPSAKVVGVVGRLRYEKDIPTTLAVAKRVIVARPNTYFLLVGDGPDRKAAEEVVRQMGLEERVFFLGFRPDTVNVYASLDLFASTSLTEGTPNTVLEAMAMEVPVVHTAVGGVPEMIEDGHDGLLCQAGDVDGISGTILSVLNDEATAATLRANGRRSVCTKFSLATRMSSIERLYKEVMQSC